ncbi:MAG: choice-of-anchor J domain-containing protein [candidate division WOR-3 bacterium]|nr:choice-of-anchor J domain-containing protein [candidate division WOR-3 bacterium]
MKIRILIFSFWFLIFNLYSFSDAISKSEPKSSFTDLTIPVVAKQIGKNFALKSEIIEYEPDLPSFTVSKISPRFSSIVPHASHLLLTGAGLDTLRNHDRTASSYFTIDSTYFATRLTMPSLSASQCTVKAIRFALYRPASTAPAPCSLLIWRDTIVNDVHRPGRSVFRSLYTIGTWQAGYYAWFSLTFTTSNITFNPGENFWIGIFCLTTDVYQLIDGSLNSDTTRNARRLPTQSWSYYNYDFLQEAVVSYTPLDNNIGTEQIVDVDKVQKSDTSISIKAQVRNYGRNTLSPGIPVILQITGTETYMDTGYTQTSLARNGTEIITFEPAWNVPNQPGDWQIKVWTELSGDPVPDNDTAQHSVFVYTHGYRQTFESTDFPPAGWTIYNFNGGNQWMRDTLSAYYTKPAGVRIVYDQYPYWPNNDWLISPQVACAPNDSIIFWYRSASASYYETLLVRISSANNLDTANFVLLQRIVTNNTNWQRKIIPLNLTDSANLYIAFHYRCFDKYWIGLDDIILPQPIPHYDFFAERIDAPNLPIIIDSVYTPKATFRNNSINTGASDVWVFYQITGNTLNYLDSTEVLSLEEGEICTITFDPFNPTEYDTIVIKTWTKNPNDQNPANDTLRRNAVIAPKYQTIPYSANFNENWGPYGDAPPFGGWRIVAGGTENPATWNTNDWYRDTCRYGSNIRTIAKIFFSPRENHNDRLISPRLNCSNPGIYNLSYWHWYRDWNSTRRDSGVVMISNNGGLTWTRIAQYTNVTDSGRKVHNISAYASGKPDVRVCFLYGAYDEYWWYLDDFSVTWYPLGPSLIYPTNRLETLAITIPFQWHSVAGATIYELQIARDSLFQIAYSVNTTSDTFYNLSMPGGTYYWRVRAGMPYGPTSEPRKLTVIPPPQPIFGWYKLKDIPLGISGKNVKDGGCLVYCPLDSSIYVLKGNNTRDFFAYKIKDSSWINKSEIPFAYLGIEPKARKVKKGASMCFGDTLIYAIKGNNADEFWVYNPKTDTWIQKKSIPGGCGKDGSSITYVPAQSKKFLQLIDKKMPQNNKQFEETSFVYLLKGANNQFEFYAYAVEYDTWIKKPNAPAGPDNKLFKAGSAIVFDGNSRIYALKGCSKVNEFYYYDIIGDSWSYRPGDSLRDTIPQRAFWDVNKKTRVKAGGALTVLNNEIYAIKGGGVNEFWKYTPNDNKGTWTLLDTIRRLDKKSVPKGGAGLTASTAKIYLQKGNNTREFWNYVPYVDKNFLADNTNSTITYPVIQEKTTVSVSKFLFDVKPNPCNISANVSCNIPQPSKISIKLFNQTGSLNRLVKESSIASGKYHIPLFLKDIPAGVYFIVIDYQVLNGDITGKKVLKIVKE